jgi:hypothetical protein
MECLISFLLFFSSLDGLCVSDFKLPTYVGVIIKNVNRRKLALDPRLLPRGFPDFVYFIQFGNVSSAKEIFLFSGVVCD